jgi:hypothetical protein
MKTHNPYIERVISELATKSGEERRSHYQHLDWILQQIEGVPSPEKESLLVYLITSTPDRPIKGGPFHSSL